MTPLAGAAYVFVRSGNSWTEEQTLVAPDGAESDDFGYSVALSADQTADRALVGAPGRDNFRGAAHVFVRIGGAWAEEQEPGHEGRDRLRQLGNAVSLAGNRALVGAYWKDDLARRRLPLRSRRCCPGPPMERGTGARRERRSGRRPVRRRHLARRRPRPDRSARSRAWRTSSRERAARGARSKRLVPSGVPSFDLFGWSVALTEDRALVGASYTDQLRGGAYVYALGVEASDAGAADAGAVDAGGAPDGEDAGSIEAGTPGSCARGNDCASGHCEDGICCDRTCAASERCRAELKVSGEDGVCGPAKAAASGASCEFDVQCTSGHCTDGVCGDTACAPDAAGTGGTPMDVPVGSLPTDDGGCACRAVCSPADGRRTWLGVALGLAFLRRRRRKAG